MSRYPRVLVAVDLKTADVETEVVQLAKKHRVLDKLLFIGRTIRLPFVRRRLRNAAPEVKTAALANSPDELPSAIDAQ